MTCYCCKKELEEYLVSEYELKKGGTVQFCIECENTAEYYFDVIKRECLIDGVNYDLTSRDKKQIRAERKLRLEKEEENRLLDCDKSIYFFSNAPVKSVEYNHQVLNYINKFIDAEDNEGHIQRFKFKYTVGQHWYFEEWEGLKNVNIYIDTVNKEVQKVKKPGDTEWRERVRKWYSGRFQCDEDFYNVTFGFSKYGDDQINDVHINYPFICSKSRKIRKLIKGLLVDKGM